MASIAVSATCMFPVRVKCLYCFRVIAYAYCEAWAPQRGSLLCPFCNATVQTERAFVVDEDAGTTWEISYQEYLQTPRWQALRAAAIEQFRGRCAVCNSGKNLNVHHREYPEVLGSEEQWQLTVLCRNCHELFHRYSKVRIMRQRA